MANTNPCGCVEDELGLPVLTCAKHDKRTARVKVAAALMQMGNCMDEAADALSRPPLDPAAGDFMREAAKYAVKAAKALLGAEDE